LKIESRNAALTLGIKKENIFFYDYPVREFDSCRQKILDTMIDLRSKLSPELILTPSVNDVHQDHSVIYNESLRCFKKKSILCYEEPWNNISFSTDFFIGLDEKHINAKINAISCYKSQSNRIYMHPDNIRALALTRGTQLNGGYAETFEVLRWII